MSDQKWKNDNLDIDLSHVPIRALSFSTRSQLSSYLNGLQYISTASGLSRDYRGIAQLMGFSYSVINTILRSNDAFNGLLEIYQNRSDANFKRLLEMIEQIERFDIIDDMTPVLLIDAKHFIGGNHLNPYSEKSREIQTINSNPIPEPIITYDAYVCYADNDLEFVQKLSQFLESPKIGLRLFIRDRDLCLGSWTYESFAHVIDRQCRKVLIILSADFLNCPECEFQTMFATGLAIEQKNRKLIPIIYKKCVLPPIVRMLTKIDMTRCIDATDWSWNRLVTSIRPEKSNNSIVYRQESRPTLMQLPSIPSDSSDDFSDQSLITLPSICPSPTAPPLISTQSSICSSINSETSDISYNSDGDPILSSNKSQKKAINKKWIHSFNPFKQKFKS